MRKRTIWLLGGIVFMGIVLFGFLQLTQKEPIKKPQLAKVWKVTEPVVQKVKTIRTREKNSTIANKKPTVEVYAFTIATVGDTITIYSSAEDEDGNISAYLWKEKGQILGSKPELSLLLSKEGTHTITLRVTDNLGAMSKGSTDIEVLAQYDKKIYSKHRDCGCESLVYTYYNEEGNITKEVSQSDRSGTEIKEFTYGEEGALLSMHYKNYYDATHLIEESTTLYDRFGNETEKFGQEQDYESENNKLVSFHKHYKYDEEGNFLKLSVEKEGVLERVEKELYINDETKMGHISENYKEGVLERQDISLSIYDEKGKLLSEIDKEYNAKTDTTTVSSSRELVYNEAGKVLEERLDNNGDGEIDTYYDYVYDEENHLLKESDKSADGRLDRLSLYSYSSDGLLLKEVTRGENTVGSIKYYSYNSAGQKTSSRTDDNGDGSIDYAFKMFYDEEGHRTKEESYNNGTRMSVNTYNSNGKITEINRDRYKTKFIYNEETGLLAQKIMEESSGRMSIRDYDEKGKLLKEVDENGNILYEVDIRE